jgi:hypothetical protein
MTNCLAPVRAALHESDALGLAISKTANIDRVLIEGGDGDVR